MNHDSQKLFEYLSKRIYIIQQLFYKNRYFGIPSYVFVILKAFTVRKAKQFEDTTYTSVGQIFPSPPQFDFPTSAACNSFASNFPENYFSLNYVPGLLVSVADIGDISNSMSIVAGGLDVLLCLGLTGVLLNIDGIT